MDDDLYDVALGAAYSCQDPGTSSEVKTTAVVTAPESSVPSEDYPALFRRLLVGARSQINELKAENERLSKNLNDALSSGGVVVCPNCTHHFKDRQCSMRPRAMRKMRARNCVELEFMTGDDLETWLYLNQLETNNDGLPTVMNVKKTSEEAPTLKTVGSLLPELVKEKKEKEPVKLKIKKEMDQKVERVSARDAKKSSDRKSKNDKKPAARSPTRPKNLSDQKTERNPRKSAEKPLEKEPKKPLSERIAFPKRAHSPPTEDQSVKPKRAPIVWEPKSLASAPAFKIPQKEPFKFVPTCQKRKPWNLIPAKKSQSVVEHAEKHEERRRNEPWKLPEETVVFEWEPKESKESIADNDKENTFFDELEEMPSTTIPSKIDIEKQEQIAEKLQVWKSIGISDEGIARLEAQLANNSKDVQSASRDIKVTPDDLTVLIPPDYKDLSVQPSPSSLIWGSNKQVACRSVENLEPEEQDLFSEFFPGYVTDRIAASSTDRLVSETASDAGSIGSVTDREEDELVDLIREESVVPPDGDEEKTLVNGDDDGFCLEDVDDEAMEMESVEGDGHSHNEDDVDEWIGLEELEERQRSQANVLTMDADFRLSDEEDLISPMTSTPKPESDEADEDFAPHIREDSFVDELDWNYGTEAEEEEVEKPEEMEQEVTKTAEKREDGELTEDDEVVEETTAETTEGKKPLRERVTFYVQKSQIDPETDDSDPGFIGYDPNIHRRRRSSEENRNHSFSRRKNNRSSGSLLKNRNH